MLIDDPRTQRLFRIAFMLALVWAAIAGGSAATAEAAPISAKLTITPTGYGNQYYVTVGGNVAGTYPNGFDTAIRLWGSDEWYDDELVGPLINTWPAYHNGFGREFIVSRDTLNEDWEGRDELYAGIRVYDHRTGRQTESVTTNMVTGYF